MTFSRCSVFGSHPGSGHNSSAGPTCPHAIRSPCWAPAIPPLVQCHPKASPMECSMGVSAVTADLSWMVLSPVPVGSALNEDITRSGCTTEKGKNMPRVFHRITSAVFCVVGLVTQGSKHCLRAAEAVSNPADHAFCLQPPFLTLGWGSRVPGSA